MKCVQLCAALVLAVAAMTPQLASAGTVRKQCAAAGGYIATFNNRPCCFKITGHMRHRNPMFCGWYGM